MTVRPIILIDEEKCTGCGQCVTACAEGALEIVDGKARLIREIYCDGLGACLGDCPEGALTIEERESAPFDEQAVERHLGQASKDGPLPCGCPGSAMRSLGQVDAPEVVQTGSSVSALSHWPVRS